MHAPYFCSNPGLPAEAAAQMLLALDRVVEPAQRLDHREMKLAAVTALLRSLDRRAHGFAAEVMRALEATSSL